MSGRIVGQRELFRAADVGPGQTPPLPAPVFVGLPDVRLTVFREGLMILRALTGRPPGACRGVLALLLRDSRDDCATVWRVLQQAAELRPVEPVAWLRAAVQPRRSATERIRDDWQLPTMADPRCFDE